MLENVSIIILVILGLALAFFGKRILETIAFIIGALLGAALALWLAPIVHDYVSGQISLEMCTIIGVIIGALIGGYLGRSLMFSMISFFTALIISGAVYSLTGDAMFSLIAFFITLILMWFLVEKFLAVITALLGGSMVGLAVITILPGMDNFISLVLFVIVAAAITIFGAKYQLSD